jgi:hypothetical protein
MWYSGSEEAMNVDGMMLNDDAYVTRKVSLMEWHAGEIKDRVLGDNIGDEDKPSTADLVEIWSESGRCCQHRLGCELGSSSLSWANRAEKHMDEGVGNAVHSVL